MPRGDGTGPTGVGPKVARNEGENKGAKQKGLRGTGAGPCAGAGNRGRMAGRSCGQPGECVCPQCGTKAPHEQGIPCLQMKCPQCGTSMVRA